MSIPFFGNTNSGVKTKTANMKSKAYFQREDLQVNFQSRCSGNTNSGIHNNKQPDLLPVTDLGFIIDLSPLR